MLMNLAASDFPQPAGTASLSKPGFDIILAVSGARQAARPTACLLRARAQRASQAARLHARCRTLGGHAGGARSVDQGPARFLDLSDRGGMLPETVNRPFTRGFQPMLNPSRLGRVPSVAPIPPSDDLMDIF